jgi:lipopolysaccharide transport system permease protein
VGGASLVKQIVFPSEILPLKLVLSNLVMLGIGLAFPIVISLFTGTAKPLGWLLLPVAIVCHVMFAAGLVYMFAAVAVFIRDLKDIVQSLLVIGLFIHPILYSPQMVPKWVDLAFHASPVSYIIWIYRDALVYGTITRPVAWLVAPVLGMLCFVVGYRVFRSLRPAFGDAL